MRAANSRRAVSYVAGCCIILTVGCAQHAELTTAKISPATSNTGPAEEASSQPRTAQLSEWTPSLDEYPVRPLRQQQLGKASYYGPEFNGRRMANGRRFDPRSTSVAHRTLPFGTKVLITHLGNGRSATAVVEDRGPFVPGRIIDLSPRLAERLDMIVQGVAPVEVTPIEVAEAPD